MSSFAWAFTIIGAMLSILSFNPFLFLGGLAVGIIGDAICSPWYATVEEAGQSPDLPEVPHDGYSCASLILWLAFWGFMVLVGISAITLIIERGPGGVQ